MVIRFAEDKDLERVNELRKQVNDLHVNGRPDIFKAGCPPELRDHVYTVFRDPRQKIVVAEMDGRICGLAVLNHLTRPETPYMYVRDYLDIDEFCVDEACRRRGAAREMMEFIKAYAKEKGFAKIELNMWEFNRGALACYEALGFSTYRRYMEMSV